MQGKMGPEFFKRTDADIEHGEKEQKIKILQELQEKVLALWAKSEKNAAGNEDDNSEDIMKAIGEIAGELSKYILDADEDKPLVHAYNSAVALKIKYSNHVSYDREELRTIATLLNAVEMEESRDKKKA
ncbi:MAG: hypothetical protein WC238_02090 [Parcubacteria group bacterium]|jgi:hypothetical protein